MRTCSRFKYGTMQLIYCNLKVHGSLPFPSFISVSLTLKHYFSDHMSHYIQADHITSNFLKAVFHKFYLVHS